MIQLRLISFNIRGSFVDDGVNSWENRRDLALEVLRSEDPHLIALQEVQEGNWSYLRENLADFEGLKGPRYNNAEPFCYPSIFWRRDLLQVVEWGQFWLSETPEVFSASWDTACTRSALWVRFGPRGGKGGQFVHLNTHLDHVSEKARREGSRLILDRLTRSFPSLPTIVTGDFNCEPGSLVHRLSLSAGFRDAHLSGGDLGGPEVFTFHAFTGRRKLGRIDWVLVRGGFEVCDCRIVTTSRPPIYPSDHYPISACLLL